MRLFVRLLARGRFQRELAPPPETRPPREQRSLRIAIIGTPNVGKSALTNQIIKTELCAVSKVIDTTRQNMITTLSEDDCQLIVVDSPGLVGIEHAKKVINTHTESKVLMDPEKALNRAEHVLVVDDVTSSGEYIHHRVLHLLHRNPHITSTLVLNKCDLIERRSNLLKRAHTLTCGTIGGKQITVEGPRLGKLGKVTGHKPSTIPLNTMENRLHDKDEKWIQSFNKVINKPTHKCSWSETKHVFKSECGWPHFSALFFVSAKTGEGIDELRAHLKSLSVPINEWSLEEHVRTTKRPQFVVAEHIRSAMLNSVPSDVAYQLKIKIVHWEREDGELRIIANVNCEKERFAKMVATALRDQVPRLEELFTNIFNVPVLLEVLAKLDGKPVAAPPPKE